MKPIYIQLIGEAFDGRSPYKVYEEDDWLTVMYDCRDNRRPEWHDLNIWLDENTDTWKWAIYCLKKERDGMVQTDTRLAISSGDAVIAKDYAGH
jgi:hypothetical protein